MLEPRRICRFSPLTGFPHMDKKKTMTSGRITPYYITNQQGYHCHGSVGLEVGQIWGVPFPESCNVVNTRINLQFEDGL